MPGEVLDQLVSLIVREIGEERRSHRVRRTRLRLARHAIAAQSHQIRVRNRKSLAELVVMAETLGLGQAKR